MSPLDMVLADFHVRFSIPVQWGDQDLFGHVNNTIYLRWFESARIAYGAASGLSELYKKRHIGPILASIHCNYRKQVTYPDTITIGAKITRIGRTSLVMAHSVFGHRHESLVADGDSTIVLFDYAAQRPIAIPDDLRAAIEHLEKQHFETNHPT